MNESSSGNTPMKKLPFDKKKWREKMYSKKYKVEEWKKQKQKEMRKQLFHDLKNDPLYKVSLPAKRNENDSDVQAGSSRPRKGKPTSVKEEIQRIRKQKEIEREQKDKKRKEKDEALMKYKEKRKDRYKFISQKTPKGQPLMKPRLKMLYEQIQEKYSENSLW